MALDRFHEEELQKDNAIKAIAASTLNRSVRANSSEQREKSKLKPRREFIFQSNVIQIEAPVDNGIKFVTLAFLCGSLLDARGAEDARVAIWILTWYVRPSLSQLSLLH